MPTQTQPAAPNTPAAPSQQFTPKLITVWREGYGWRDLRADAIAGATVAVVALPLSMGIAIASGVSPERGLFTAIVGGFFVSLLGGSRYQIGGPAGAFIALVATIIERHGYDGLALATLMAGVLMTVIALLRAGSFIRYIPFPVTVGFTAGIAVIIVASQIRDLFGLNVAHEPADLLPKLEALRSAWMTFNWQAAAVAALSIATILGVRKWRPQWPSFLIAIVVAAAAAALLHLDVATIGSRFGEIPRTLPMPALPPVSWDKVQAVLPDAIAITLLGAIESLLSAVVADQMSGAHHRSNGELGAQGIANVAAVIFGGICVTGTIARTATNVRAGARGPISGMLHCGYLLAFLFVAAPLVGMIPLAALAGMLVVVSWNMTDKAELVKLMRGIDGGTAVLAATFLVTIFYNLLAGIAVGCAISFALHFFRNRNTV